MRFERADAEGRAPGPEDLWEEAGGVSWGAHATNALRARWLYERNVHYIVRDGEARIIDAATGRIIPMSRWTDGLHQARGGFARSRAGWQWHWLAKLVFAACGRACTSSCWPVSSQSL